MPGTHFVALLPGEKLMIHTEVENADTRGDRPRIVDDGFNLTMAEK